MSKSYKKNPIIKYGGYSKYGKRLASHKWRKSQEENYDIKSLYKRNYPYYDINDVVDMWTKEDACAHYDKTKERLATLVCRNNSFDYILSHTAPLNYEPRYLFLSIIDQSTVDKSMENYLQWIYDNIDKETLKMWFFWSSSQ